ncbi:MAG TPA: alanine--tRNA ligase [Verrucomicrobia bacterium]|nr:MAG: alanine--tRNA ligase [Lentisphaerae bacterium GWF2_57_35]HBA83957.1 alanine--tRNA ligase [Verrucomicrobiota bacterium]
MTASEIRQSFLDYFKSKEHEIVPSSPVVLPTDPTLLFTNAGMNQFKEIFLGARESSYKRVADTQKCIRVSGKHNDLEEVGIDTYHHTFFEMLGNWSFGNYYKREAIQWAWELMTTVWKLPKQRLWATVFREDDEAVALWKEVTDIDPTHILKFNEKDNFWEMGETGPCGPCSEIHFDRTPNGCGPELVNAGSPEVIELWNLVFIQYNRKSDGSLEELPSKHVDTGMGLERVVSVLQNKTSNYDTDLFSPLLDRLCEMTGCKYEGQAAVAMRVIADHLRTLSFAVGDGVLPSNDGRGYVLRRLLRRAARYGRKIGLNEPFMCELFPVLEKMMSPVFPELTKQRAQILRALKAEEESFAATLDRGINLFDEVVADLKSKKETLFPGHQAFKLYDTFGFPVDLTILMASENGLAVDQEQFRQLMEEQRDRARGARRDGALDKEMDLVSSLVARGIKSAFTGYEALEDEAEVLAVLSDGRELDELVEGTSGELLLSKTPFYAESGGQLGDKGIIRCPTGEFEVLDTQRPAEGVVLHVGKVTQGKVARGGKVAAMVDGDRRGRLIRHHSATHLLNCALHELVSPTLKQAGSFVAPDRFRFDFTHFEGIHPDKIEAVEHRVNELIMENLAVKTYQMPLKDVPNSGIIAVFDEKYGDVVRVVDMAGVSRELCGGTHVKQTGQIGFFRIVSESSVAAGVRRIEGVCGWPAYEMTQREHDLVRSMAQRFSATPEDLETRIDSLIEQNRKLEKEMKQNEAKAAAGQAESLADRRQDVGGISLISEAVGELSMDALRGMMDVLRAKLDSGVIVLGSVADGKACFMASVSDDLVKKGVHAGRMIGQVAKLAGGGGGGQPGKAQAGGKDASKVGEAIAQVPQILAGFLK